MYWEGENIFRAHHNLRIKVIIQKLNLILLNQYNNRMVFDMITKRYVVLGNLRTARKLIKLKTTSTFITRDKCVVYISIINHSFIGYKNIIK